MATKISGLSSATNIGASDWIQVVDVNDPTMALTGTNKKATAQVVGNNLPVVATGSTTSRKLKDRFADTVNVKDFGAAGDGIQDDTAAIQAAINYASLKRSKVVIPAGTYNVTFIKLGSYVSIYGDGAKSTILKQTAVGSAIFYNYDVLQKEHIYVDSIGFDVNLKDSGITLKNVKNLTVKNCAFQNNPAWGIHVGIEEARASSSTLQTCEDILIENCSFNNTTSTYEHILLFNGRNMVVRDCEFIGALTGGIGIGLYQNLSDITISGCSFKNITKGMYYSVSTDNISITDSTFKGCTIGIQGANESDHGLFGDLWAYGLYIDTCRFIENTWALEIGSVRGGTVTNCQFEKNFSNAIVFSYGNRLVDPVIQQSVNILVQGCNFINNNQSGLAPLLHPAILFNEGGGTFYVTIVGCNFFDTQNVATQLNPIVFYGDFTWSGIRLFGCRLGAYGGGNSITASGSATLNDVKLYGCYDVTSPLPSGVTAL